MPKMSQYLLFLNSLTLKIGFESVLEVREHEKSFMRGWIGVETITSITTTKEIYDIDIRYAWGTEIFKQNLIDHGWSENTLLGTPKNQAKRFKIIIYLCEDLTNISHQEQYETVPERFLVGNYWQTINHVYLKLPTSHPFIIPAYVEQKKQMGYSTTCLLTKDYANLTTEIASEKNKDILFLPFNTKRSGEGGLRTKGFFKTSKPEQPLISVITVVFNGEKYIEQTIQSVINQSYENIEYIVIDGGSTDETVNIIKKYDDQINYWVSEPDTGIYDAMNKGTLLACGSHTLHTNADDLLFSPQAVKLNCFDANHLRSVLIYHINDELIIKSPPKPIDSNMYINIIHVPVHHPGFIALKTPYSVFDSSYRIIADSILIAEKVKNEKVDVSSDILAIYRSGGISNENNFKILKELRRALSGNMDISVWKILFIHDVYCRLRDIAKNLGLVKLKRRYFG